MTEELRRSLNLVTLWGLGVGYVISGEYFGWNLGLPLGGSYGMLIATALVAIMYLTFVFVYAELACSLPHAGGAFVYATRAFGPRIGLLAGVFQLVEFVFAPPAIALAIGSYVANFVPEIAPHALAMIAYVVFTALNIWGVRQTAVFELLVTFIAVLELVLFMVITAPSFEWRHVADNAWPHGWSGTFAAIPFAIWFFLGIEGIANTAEEVRNPQRNIPIGFASSIFTLLILAIGVLLCAIGVAGWQATVYPGPGLPPSDSPLPLAMANAVSRSSWWFDILVTVGLFGLVASFNGLLFAAGRATMELGRAQFFPAILGHIHPSTQTPVIALIANMCVGLIALLAGKTNEIITLSVLGTLFLYAISILSFFRLRAREPNLHRPFRAYAHPWLPAIALLITTLCIVSALANTSPGVLALFAAMAMMPIVFAQKRHFTP